ncbi:uncharacterized protein LOC120484140 [Tachysurus ichikawai]
MSISLAYVLPFKTSEDSGKSAWIRENKRCWKCGLNHLAADCDLKKPCPQCNGKHLGILHGVNCREQDKGAFYLSRLGGPGKVLLKDVAVLLHYKGRSLQTDAILDDGSERTPCTNVRKPGLIQCVSDKTILGNLGGILLSLEGYGVEDFSAG